MTVRQFLQSTDIPFSALAREVRTHVTRIYQWRDGQSAPRGKQLARLIIASGGAVTIAAVAGKPVPKNLNAKTA